MKSIYLLALTILLSSPIDALALDSSSSGDWNTYSKAGTESLAIGDYVSAETQLRSALDIVQRNSALKSALPDLQAKYTEAFLWQGKFSETAKELKKALSYAKSISGENTKEYAKALELESWLLQAQGKSQDAIEELRNATSIYEVKAPGTPELSDAYEHMGRLQEAQGLYEQAAQNYEKALAIRKKISGESSIDVADLYESLAHTAQRRGRTADANSLYASALRIKESRGEPYKKYAPEPTERVVSFRYFPGAPFCETATAAGALVEKINANGITVEAALSQKPSDFAKTTRAQVRIVNDSQYDVDILSQSPTFIQLTPKVEILKPINAQSLAAQIQKKGESKAKWIRFWGADAMTPVTSTMWTQNQPMYGYVPTAFGYAAVPAGRNNWRNNNYSTTNVTTMVPDWQAREEARRKAEAATNASKADAEAVLDAALGPNRLPAGGVIQGTLDFELSKYKSAILRIPVGNAIYEFRFE